jgi:Mce-associated membrane protein
MSKHGMGEPEEPAESVESELESTDLESAELEQDEAEAEPGPAANFSAPQPKKRSAVGINWVRVAAYRVLPALALVLAAAAGGLWYLTARHGNQADQATVIKIASDGTVALLSYEPDTVRQQLTDARKLLTTPFLDEYTTLTKSVIPGAEQRHIAAATSVPAAAAVSVEENHAVVLVFVNQTVRVGDQPPTSTPTSARVTLERLGGQWLIAKFEPV